MIEFAATYYAGKHPVGEPVVIRVTENGSTNFSGDNISYTCDWLDIGVSIQLGTTARTLKLPNGGKCESSAHDEINQLQDLYGRSTLGKLLHKLESRWHYVLIASVMVVGFTWAMITYGIPALAKQVAFALPTSVDESISEGTLDILEKHLLKTSTLGETDKTRIREKFSVIAEQANDGHRYELLYRRGIGPNAFALPSGHIVITDELIEMADTDEEILAVLAHEIGHVVYKHGIRSVLQSSAVALLLTAVTGDISTASGFAAAMPILLLETSYSRKFEHEADQYAFEYMQANNIDTKHFATILHKITGDDHEQTESVFNYLSTHPMTSERTRRFIDSEQKNK